MSGAPGAGRPGPGGVPAAPNRCRLTAECLELHRSPDSPRKWLLRLAVRTVQPLRGGQFARPGDHVDAFTFGEVAGLAPGRMLTAEAEYIGQARRGGFQLYDVSVA